MRPLTDGEVDILRELEHDAREIADEYDGWCDEWEAEHGPDRLTDDETAGHGDEFPY